MKKIIIGVSASANAITRQAIASLAEEFNLEHISMRQPLINMVATLTNLNPTHQEFSYSPLAQVEHLNISIAELEVALGFTLRTIKADFFINRCIEAIAISNSGLNGELFSGHIISGIKTELEAQWLRDQGGILLHLYNYDNTNQFHALHEKHGDLVCVIDSATNLQHLPATAAAITARLSIQKKAA